MQSSRVQKSRSKPQQASGVLQKVYPYICSLESLIRRLQRRVNEVAGEFLLATELDQLAVRTLDGCHDGDNSSHSQSALQTCFSVHDNLQG